MIKDNINSNECIHNFEKLGNPVLKTIDGFYKWEEDYKEGEAFQFYICSKCRKIECVDFNLFDDKPVVNFEKVNNIRKR